MLLESRIENGVAVVRINAPRIEARIADELTEGLIASLESAQAAIIDFSQVGFIDSVGMKTLMTVLLHCRKSHTACVLHGVSEDIMSVFVITRLNKLLPLAQDEDEALEQIQALLEVNRQRLQEI